MKILLTRSNACYLELVERDLPLGLLVPQTRVGVPECNSACSVRGKNCQTQHLLIALSFHNSLQSGALHTFPMAGWRGLGAAKSVGADPQQLAVRENGWCSGEPRYRIWGLLKIEH